MVLTTLVQEAVIALGIYFIESGYRHQDRCILLLLLLLHLQLHLHLHPHLHLHLHLLRLLDYLISLHRGLATATFPDEQVGKK